MIPSLLQGVNEIFLGAKAYELYKVTGAGDKDNLKLSH